MGEIKIQNTKYKIQIGCAMRGRNPDNPSDRTAGIYLEQKLELRSDNLCNCLTTVTKDYLVLEVIIE